MAKNAIAIDMNHGNGWYIASELTALLHLLIKNEKIVDVNCLAHTGNLQSFFFFAKMGYNPLISIIRKERWGKYLLTRCHSAR